MGEDKGRKVRCLPAYRSRLEEMGFTDLSKVSIHGYGGWILDENFSKAGYLDDVPSVPVWTNGNALFFYAKGPVKWEYDSRNDSLSTRTILTQWQDIIS